MIVKIAIISLAITLVGCAGTSSSISKSDLLEQGLEAYANQDFQTASEKFNRLLEIDPKSSIAKEYYKRSNERLRAGTNTDQVVSCGPEIMKELSPSRKKYLEGLIEYT